MTEPQDTLARIQKVFPSARIHFPPRGDWFTVYVHDLPHHYEFSEEVMAYVERDQPPTKRVSWMWACV